MKTRYLILQFFLLATISPLFTQTVTIVKNIESPQNGSVGVFDSDKNGFYITREINKTKKYYLVDMNGNESPTNVRPDEGFSVNGKSVGIMSEILIDGKKISIGYMQGNEEVKAYGFITDTLTNKQIGEPVLLAEEESKSWPRFIVNYSPEKAFISLMIEPHHTVNSGTVTKIELTHAGVYVFNSELKPEWKRRIDYEDNMHIFNLQTGIDDDGNFYALHGIKAGKNTDRIISYELASYTSDEFNSHEIQNVNIKHAFMIIEKDAIKIVGLKAADDEEYDMVNGAFWSLYDLETLKPKDEHVDDFSVNTMEKFMTNNFLRKQMEKGRGIANMKLYPATSYYDPLSDPVYYEFGDGTIAMIARHIAQMETGSLEYDYGSILVVLYRPTGEYKEVVIRAAQRSVTGLYMNYVVTMANDRLFIFMNDAPENSEPFTESEPEKFYATMVSPVPGQTATSVIIIGPEGEAKRLKVADYKEDAFLLSYYAYTFDGKTFMLMGDEKARSSMGDSDAAKLLLIRIGD